MKIRVYTIATLLFIFEAVSPTWAQECPKVESPKLQSIDTCKNGEFIITSQDWPGGIEKRCGKEKLQWRILQSCQDKKAIPLSTEEFISFAKDNRSDPTFLEALVTTKIIPSATSQNLDAYVKTISENVKSSKGVNTSIFLNDDGDVKELPGLEILKKQWGDWRITKGQDPQKVLSNGALKATVNKSMLLLQQFLALNCDSPQAKKLYEEIKVPVIRFSDNVEQVILPFQIGEEKDKKFEVGHISGGLNNGGLFALTTKKIGFDYQKRTIQVENGKTYWVNPGVKYEVTSVRETTLKEATQNIYQKVDICKAQGLLRAAPIVTSRNTKQSDGTATDVRQKN